jgi:CBS domain-containing protein
MATDVLAVSPDTTIADAARRMVTREIGAAVVIEDDVLVGVISERDLMRAIPDACAPETPVSERMSRHVMSASPKTSIPEAMAMMIDGHFRHLPVVEEGRVLGMVSMRDLMSWTSLRLRLGALEGDDEVDSAELLATIHRMRTGAA